MKQQDQISFGFKSGCLSTEDCDAVVSGMSYDNNKISDKIQDFEWFLIMNVPPKLIDKYHRTPSNVAGAVIAAKYNEIGDHTLKSLYKETIDSDITHTNGTFEIRQTISDTPVFIFNPVIVEPHVYNRSSQVKLADIYLFPGRSKITLHELIKSKHPNTTSKPSEPATCEPEPESTTGLEPAKPEENGYEFSGIIFGIMTGLLIHGIVLVFLLKVTTKYLAAEST